jgi:hypothetical protein
MLHIYVCTWTSLIGRPSVAHADWKTAATNIMTFDVVSSHRFHFRCDPLQAIAIATRSHIAVITLPGSKRVDPSIDGIDLSVVALHQADPWRLPNLPAKSCSYSALILGNTSTLARSKTGFRSDIQTIRFRFCKPLPSRTGCSRDYQKKKKNWYQLRQDQVCLRLPSSSLLQRQDHSTCALPCDGDRYPIVFGNHLRRRIGCR